MKISKLIDFLQDYKTRCGEINVNIFEYNGEGETAEICFCLMSYETDIGVEQELTLGDSSFVDAFA